MHRKKLLCLLAAAALLAGCAGETKTITCDGCGADIVVEADSKITDDWIVFCKICEQELFGGTGVVEGKPEK